MGVAFLEATMRFSITLSIISIIFSGSLFASPTPVTVPHVDNTFSTFMPDDATSRGRKRRWKCIAKNGRGYRFHGKARYRFIARNRALRKCRNHSFRPRSCYIARCRRRWHHM